MQHDTASKAIKRLWVLRPRQLRPPIIFGILLLLLGIGAVAVKTGENPVAMSKNASPSSPTKLLDQKTSTEPIKEESVMPQDNQQSQGVNSSVSSDDSSTTVTVNGQSVTAGPDESVNRNLTLPSDGTNTEVNISTQSSTSSTSQGSSQSTHSSSVNVHASNSNSSEDNTSP